MEYSEKIFFTLLRSAIWDKTPILECTPSEEDWNDIYRISREQTVSGIILDAISKLPETQRPPKILLLQWIMQQKIIEKQNTKMNSVLNDIYSGLKDKGIRTYLLKGQGVAQNYLHPLHRQCGDIDLYFNKNDFEKAIEYFVIKGCHIEDEPASSHAETIYNDFKIEIHKKNATFYTQKLQKAYDDITARIICDKEDYVTIVDKEIEILPPIVNALQLLSHMQRHILFSGLGLRQICDWVYFVYRYQDRFDKKQFIDYMKKLQLYQTYKSIMYIAINYIGLPAKFAVCEITSKEKKLAKNVLNLIMAYGNFGIYSDHYTPQTKWEYLKSYVWKVKNCIRFRKLSKSEAWNYPIWQLHSITKFIK